jgi:hypothetical protein
VIILQQVKSLYGLILDTIFCKPELWLPSPQKIRGGIFHSLCHVTLRKLQSLEHFGSWISGAIGVLQLYPLSEGRNGRVKWWLCVWSGLWGREGHAHPVWRGSTEEFLVLYHLTGQVLWRQCSSIQVTGMQLTTLTRNNLSVNWFWKGLKNKKYLEDTRKEIDWLEPHWFSSLD